MGKNKGKVKKREKGKTTEGNVASKGEKRFCATAIGERLAFGFLGFREFAGAVGGESRGVLKRRPSRVVVNG